MKYSHERVTTTDGKCYTLIDPHEADLRIVGRCLVGVDYNSGAIHMISSELVKKRTKLVDDPLTGELVTVASAKESQKHIDHTYKANGSKKTCPCEQCRRWRSQLEKYGVKIAD